jgi:hypothetical protein
VPLPVLGANRSVGAVAALSVTAPLNVAVPDTPNVPAIAVLPVLAATVKRFAPTVSSEPGFVLAMPKLPALSIRILSVLLMVPERVV